MSRNRVDFTVVIALEEEFNEFSDVLIELGASIEPDEVDCKLFRIKRRSRSGIISGDVILVKKAGGTPALLVTERYLNNNDTRLLVSMGISGAISSDLKLGDVVIAETCFDYAGNIKVSSGDKASKPDKTTFELVPYVPTDSIYDQLALFKGRRPDDYNLWRASSYDRLNKYVGPKGLALLEKKKIVLERPDILLGSIGSGPYVVASSEFRELLKNQGMRKLLCVDQESAQVLQAVKGRKNINTLVIRGISDGADGNKNALEQASKGIVRRWALYNCVKLFDMFLSISSFEDDEIIFDKPKVNMEPADHALELQRLALQFHLRPPFHQMIVPEDLIEYGHLFRGFSQEKHAPDGDFLEAVVSSVSSGAGLAHYITGRPGSGKTAMLSALYWHAWNLYQKDPGKHAIPVFVSTRWIESGSSSPEEDDVRLLSFLKALESLIKSSDSAPIWILIDAAGSSDIMVQKSQELLLATSHIGGRRQIISTRELDSYATSNVVARLGEAPVSEVRDLLGSFVKVSRPRPAESHSGVIETVLLSLGLDEIDLYILSKCHDSAIGQGAVTCDIAELLRIHVRKNLHISAQTPLAEKDRLLLQAGREAYQMRMGVTLGKGEAPANSSLFSFLDQHHLFQDYLTARHVVKQYEAAAADEKFSITKYKELSAVYPHRVNRFVKALVNRNGRENRRTAVIKAIEKIIRDKNSSFNALANAVYVASRISDAQNKHEARRIIERVKKGIGTWKQRINDDNKKSYLLFERTVYISLAAQGDTSAEDYYIGAVLEKTEYDQINRGFHLEYYGDIPFRVSDPLVHVDELQPFPKTFNELLRRISSDTQGPLFSIEVLTICSLALQRHAVGKESLDIKQREALAKCLVDKEIESKVRECLRSFVGFAVRMLEKDSADFSRIRVDMLKLKFLPRSGWLKRDIKYPETVATHAYNAYEIGLLFLPDAIPGEPEYNKDRILKMILVHDMAEAITGDLLPSQKTEKAKEYEKQIFRDLGHLSVLDGFPDLRWVSEFALEFAAGTTINARHAIELDKLDNLYELYYLRAVGEVIPDFDDFEKDLNRSILSGPGKHIRAFFQEYFASATPPSRFSSWSIAF